MEEKTLLSLDLEPEDWRKLRWLMKHYGLDAQQVIEKCIMNGVADLILKDQEAGRATPEE